MGQRCLKWQITVFSYVTSCGLVEIYMRFEKAWRLHLQEYLRQSVAAVQLCVSKDHVFVQWNQLWIIRYSPRNAKIDLRDNLLVFCACGRAL